MKPLRNINGTVVSSIFVVSVELGKGKALKMRLFMSNNLLLKPYEFFTYLFILINT